MISILPILIGILIAAFPIVIVVAINIFCLRIAREVAPKGEHGSIITSPLLYLYFICVYPFTLMIAWFPIGLSLLFLYGEDNEVSMILPKSMDEQMLVLILFIVLLTLIVAGFSIRAGELHRTVSADMGQPPVPPPSYRGGGQGGSGGLHTPAGMLT